MLGDLRYSSLGTGAISVLRLMCPLASCLILPERVMPLCKAARRHCAEHIWIPILRKVVSSKNHLPQASRTLAGLWY